MGDKEYKPGDPRIIIRDNLTKALNDLFIQDPVQYIDEIDLDIEANDEDVEVIAHIGYEEYTVVGTKDQSFVNRVVIRYFEEDSDWDLDKPIRIYELHLIEQDWLLIYK